MGAAGWGQALLPGRAAADVAHGMARWFAVGGAHHNYYMWHGGTALPGPISTVLTGLSWICMGIYMCGAPPSPVCA